MKMTLLKLGRDKSPFAIFLAMACAIFLLDAVLPLRNLWFREALLTQLGPWPVFPTLLLFPGRSIIPVIPGKRYVKGPPNLGASWLETFALLVAFLLVFLVYLLALRYLPQQLARNSSKEEGKVKRRALRFLFSSTFLLGLLYAIIPVVTSSDLFSYITYARIGVIYHLNPLATLPTAIRTDEVYTHITWTTQPSAYGPTWIFITCFLQWLFTLFGSQYLLPMVIALRLFGLAMHLCSTALIWSMIQHLQHRRSAIYPPQDTGSTYSGLVDQRSELLPYLATLAFAWNPFLLFDASVNAHIDTTILLFILLTLWLLVRTPQPTTRTFLLAATILAFATCLKVNTLLLFPGLVLFLWMQSPHRFFRLSAVVATYLGIIVLLYAPFWQNGRVLTVLQVNPATNRNINSPVEFLGQLYNGIASAFGAPLAASIGSPAEHFTHTASMLIFVVIYAALCLQTVLTPNRIKTLPSLIRWWMVIWLLYCAIGSPWFWPWYAIIFLGLYALIEVDDLRDLPRVSFFRLPLATRLFTFSMLTLYCFYAWAPQHSFIPGLPGFQWAYLRGLWVWGLPLLAFHLDFNLNRAQRYRFGLKKPDDTGEHAALIR